MPTELLKGTLDLLILRTLNVRPSHGLEIARRIQQITQSTFDIKGGSLFPALHRLEEQGWVSSEWTEVGKRRRAKIYRLTKAGQKRIATETENWRRISAAMARAIKATS